MPDQSTPITGRRQFAALSGLAADSGGDPYDDAPNPLETLADKAGILRYGVPTSEKERLAASGSIPGSPSSSPDLADRHASGYQFGKTWGPLAKKLQPYIDMVKTSDLPFFGGDSPEKQSWATTGLNRGLQDWEEAQKNAPRPTPMPSQSEDR